MAFNPFHHFRKHQKPLIAALAIFCMFMFVVSSGLGKGDAVYQLLGIIGIGRGGGSLVATLHGRKVTEGDLSRLARDRDLASRFLYRVAEIGARTKVMQLARAQQAKMRDNKEGAPADAQFNQTLSIWAGIYSGQFSLSPAQRNEVARKSLQMIRDQARLSAITNPDGMKSLEDLSRVLEFEVWMGDPRRNRKEYYFGGTPDTADLLDFLLWEQQADRLGVVLTEVDVINAVNHEGGDETIVTGPTFGGDLLAREYTSGSNSSNRGATPEQLATALNREFRYLIAQESVLGLEGGIRARRVNVVPQIPAAGTPREFLDWFRARRTTLHVAMLPISVESFVNKVEGTPPESILKDLYEQYKMDEPAPDRQQPGFKEPRRIRVETVSARADSEFYRQAALRQAIMPAVGALVGGPFQGPIAASWPVAYDPLWRAYASYAATTGSWVDRKFGVGTDLTDRRPLYAAIAGLTIGATPGGSLSAATSVSAESVFYNVGLAKVAGSVLAAGAGGQPLAAIGLPFPYRTSVLPPDQVEGALFAKVVDSLAPSLVTKNLDQFVAELAKLKNRPAEAEAYVSKAIKEFGLSHTLMSEEKTSYQLEDDPALKALKSAVETEALAAAVSDADTPPPELAKVLLGGVGVYDPQRYPPGRWDLVKEPIVWWRVKDLPARERPYAAVKKEVEQAWRLEKARALARAAAERVEADVKKNVATNKSAAEATKVLRSFGPPEYGSEFELNDVARLLPVDTPLAGSGQPYVPYTVPRDRILYPRADLVDRLMTLKEPGDVTILKDKPAKNLYVAVLQERSDPTMSGSKPKLDAFLQEYSNASKSSSLWQQQFMLDQRRAYIRNVEKQMRIDAVGAKDVDDDGNIILPAGITRGTETESSE